MARVQVTDPALLAALEGPGSGRQQVTDPALLSQLEAAPEQPSLGEAVARGAAQGATAGFQDEMAGAMRSAPGAFAMEPLGAALHYAYRKLAGDHSKDAAYSAGRDDWRAGDTAASAAHPVASGISNVVGGALTLPATGLLGTIGTGAALGLGNSEADLHKGEYAKAGLDTLIGGTGGAIAHGAGQALSGAAGWVGKKASALKESLLGSAAEKAAAATATARSEAGQAAQDAYRQLEHLRELRATQPEVYAGLEKAGVIDPQQVASLESELLSKSAEKLPASAARKESKALLLKEAMASEADRAAALGAEATSAKRAREIVGNPGIRYLKRAAAGVAGAGVGSLLGGEDFRGEGALGGALALGPLVPTMLKAIGRPEVRYQGARLLTKALGKLAPAARGGIQFAGAPAAEPSVERFLLEHVPALADLIDPEAAKRRRLATAGAP